MRNAGQECAAAHDSHAKRHGSIALAAALLTGAAVSGCGGAGMPDSPQARMISHSLVSMGNTNRLSRVFDRAQAGQDITIAYVGGSITEGYAAGARSPECYASLSASEFQAAYCQGGTVTCQNNAISGTPSLIGCLRAEGTVLSAQPDIIFIEYAVNDGQEPLYQTAYESLVRTCLEAPNEPAVILLFTYMENGHTCQVQQQEIGAYYDLGMISVRDALLPEMEAGTMQWSDYGADDVHPSAAGHRLLADLIAGYFAAAKKHKPEKSYTVPAEPLHENLFRNAKLCDASDTLYRDGSWAVGSHYDGFMAGFTYQNNGKNEPLVMNLTGRSLFLIYKKCSDPAWGLAGVYVNGSLAGVVNANAPDGWGGPAVELIETYDAVQELHVEIKMLDDQTDKSFEILALGVCE